MIVGRVTAELEAIVRLQIRGAAADKITDIDAILDTGFNDQLTMPRSLIQSLGLPFQTVGEAKVAGEVLISTTYFQATVRWGDVQKRISVMELEGAPLLGMALLIQHRIMLDVIAGGSVTIENV